MNTLFLKLGWRTLLRDLRAGELRLLIVAVTLAVAALTAVGFFADRLKGGLQRDALQLLGGDAVVRSDGVTPAAFIAKALGDIARAKGMSQVARDAGLSRESLYKALSGERSPGFDTILKVIGALGLKLHAEANRS